MFVANPKKPPQIESILKRNKEKLLVFLKDFHNDKDGALRLNSMGCLKLMDDIDEQFTDEKQFLIVQIQNL